MRIGIHNINPETLTHVGFKSIYRVSTESCAHVWLPTKPPYTASPLTQSVTVGPEGPDRLEETDALAPVRQKPPDNPRGLLDHVGRKASTMPGSWQTKAARQPAWHITTRAAGRQTCLSARAADKKALDATDPSGLATRAHKQA